MNLDEYAQRQGHENFKAMENTRLRLEKEKHVFGKEPSASPPPKMFTPRSSLGSPASSGLKRRSPLRDKELRTAAPGDVPGKCKHELEMTCAPVLGIPMSNTHSHIPQP